MSIFYTIFWSKQKHKTEKEFTMITQKQVSAAINTKPGKPGLPETPVLMRLKHKQRGKK